MSKKVVTFSRKNIEWLHQLPQRVTPTLVTPVPTPFNIAEPQTPAATILATPMSARYIRQRPTAELAVYAVAALHQGSPGQTSWLEDPSPWLRPACCFASVIVWTENKNVTISDRFICFILTVKQSAALAACVLTATTKKGRQLFEEKKCIPRENSGYAPDSGWPGLRIFGPRNDLAPLLRWRRHCMYARTHRMLQSNCLTSASATNFIPHEIG